jgi:hypothetical protein
LGAEENSYELGYVVDEQELCLVAKGCAAEVVDEDLK